MSDMGHEFRDWIAGRSIEGCTVEVVDEGHVVLKSEDAKGHVNFHEFEGAPDIVELNVIENGREDPLFFLHFELVDLGRAKELFYEMVEALQALGASKTVRVLLCCTVGMTTTLFASKLSEVAKVLDLDYSFEAKSFDVAKAEGGAYDAVLLAPQVGFRRREVASAMPDAAVIEIPGKVFGSLDAKGALRMLMGILGDQSLSMGDPADLRLVREMKSDKTIMVISAIKRPRVSTISYRVYDRLKLVASEDIHKRVIGPRDLEDILATLHFKDVDLADLDAVGIALPGSVDFGQVTSAGNDFTGCDIEGMLNKRFGVRVFVDNNANAGAVGCYMRSNEYDSVTLHTQQVGYLEGGQGTVANGHLLRGRGGRAGEMGALTQRLLVSGGLHLEGQHDSFDELAASDIPWRADRMLPILATMLLANITVAAPDAIYVAYDLIDDMDALRKELAKDVPLEQIPDLIHITDYHDRVIDGELALTLQRLNTSAE